MGDLHGEIALLRAKLAEVNFDLEYDRLFSVGDLTDRGPHSLDCLRLLQEPWFFAVMGNHDHMLDDYVNHDRTGLWLRNDGDWYPALPLAMQQEVQSLAAKVSQLPCVYVVGDGPQRFHVVHAELSCIDANLESSWTTTSADTALWARRVAKHYGRYLMRHRLERPRGQPLRFAEVRGHIDYQPIRPGLSLTFCGHTWVARPGLWRSQYFLDTGCGYADGDGLTLLPVAEALAEFDALRQWKLRDRSKI